MFERTWQTDDDDLLALRVIGYIDLLRGEAEIKFDAWDFVSCFDGCHVFVVLSLPTKYENDVSQWPRDGDFELSATASDGGRGTGSAFESWSSTHFTSNWKKSRYVLSVVLPD